MASDASELARRLAREAESMRHQELGIEARGGGKGEAAGGAGEGMANALRVLPRQGEGDRRRRWWGRTRDGR